MNLAKREQQERHVTALHEASHAVMTVLLGGTVDAVFMDDDYNDDDYYIGRQEEDTPHPRCYSDTPVEHEMAVLVHFAGLAAECVFLGMTWSKTINHVYGGMKVWLQAADCRGAKGVIDLIAKDDRHHKQVVRHYQKLSIVVVRRHWKYIQTVANALLAKDELDGDEVKQLLVGMPPLKLSTLNVPPNMVVPSDEHERNTNRLRNQPQVGDTVTARYGKGVVVGKSVSDDFFQINFKTEGQIGVHVSTITVISRAQAAATAGGQS